MPEQHRPVILPDFQTGFHSRIGPCNFICHPVTVPVPFIFGGFLHLYRLKQILELVILIKQSLSQEQPLVFESLGNTMINFRTQAQRPATAPLIIIFFSCSLPFSCISYNSRKRISHSRTPTYQSICFTRFLRNGNFLHFLKIGIIDCKISV